MANDTEKVPTTPTIEAPNPQIAGEQGEQSLGQAADSSVNLKAILASPEFEEFIEKKVQSKSDKRLGQYGTRLESLEDAISQYTALTGSEVDVEALGKMQGNQTLADLRAEIDALKGNVVVGGSERSELKTLDESQQAILSKHGLEKADARAHDLAKSKIWSSRQEYLDALQGQAAEWEFSDSTKPQPTSSTVAPTIQSAVVGGGEYPDISSDALGDKMAELLSSPSINQAEIDKIGVELTRRDKIGE